MLDGDDEVEPIDDNDEVTIVEESDIEILEEHLPGMETVEDKIRDSKELITCIGQQLADFRQERNE